MLSSALTGAVAGMKTTGARIDTVTKNVTNANTAGFAKRVQEQRTDPAGGVRAGDVARVVDETLVREHRGSVGRAAEQGVLAEALARIDTLSGKSDDRVSLVARFADLEADLRTATVRPSDENVLIDAVDAARKVAQTFQTVSQEVTEVRVESAKEITRVVGDIAEIVGNIADLNKGISRSSGPGRDVNALYDERDRQILALSELMEVDVQEDAAGNAIVTTKSGRTLVGLDGPAAVSASAAGDLVVNGVIAAPGRGTLSGHQAVAREIAPRVQEQLDDLAAAAAEMFAFDEIVLFTDAGDVPFDPADPTQQVGFASRIQVNSAIVGDPHELRGAVTDAGDASRLTQMLTNATRGDITFTAPGLPSVGSIASASTSLVAGVAGSYANAKADLDAANSYVDLTGTMATERSEVDLDSELATLIMLQNAYQASARVVQLTQRLSDELLETVR